MSSRQPEPIDFLRYPRQFLISPESQPAPRISHGYECLVQGWRVQAAHSLPSVRLEDADGERIGLILGWPILDGQLWPDGSAIRLRAGESVETAILQEVAGRALVLWRSADGMAIELDSGGYLPAVFAPEPGLIASTTTMIAAAHPAKVNTEIAEIHDFPQRRGYLPFGLTHLSGVRRLLPGHRLSLGGFDVRRVWPTPEAARQPRISEAAAETEVSGIAERLCRQTAAVAKVAPPRLYLSGGFDSRLILATLRPEASRLTCETFALPGPDTYLGRRLAQMAGAQFREIRTIPTPRDEVLAWIERTGRTYYENLTELAATVRAHDPGQHVMDGSGSEILRDQHWWASEPDAPHLTREAVIAFARIRPLPAVIAAVDAWLDSLPGTDTARSMDLMKIEVMHACWAGPPLYGPMIKHPSLSPFSTRRMHDAALRLPISWRLGNRCHRHMITALWPELLSLPVNHAMGMSRLRFFRDEIRRGLPNRVKRWFKPLR